MLEARLGGTDLDQPLRIALAPAPLGAALLHRRARPRGAAAPALPAVHDDVIPRVLGSSARSVFLFTDGEVGNTRDLIASAREAAAGPGTRIHCFGIGNGVSTELVQGLADATGGQCAMLADGEAYAPKVRWWCASVSFPVHAALPAAPLRRPLLRRRSCAS